MWEDPLPIFTIRDVSFHSLRLSIQHKILLRLPKPISISIISTEKQIIDIVRLTKPYLFFSANNRNRDCCKLWAKACCCSRAGGQNYAFLRIYFISL